MRFLYEPPICVAPHGLKLCQTQKNYKSLTNQGALIIDRGKSKINSFFCDPSSPVHPTLGSALHCTIAQIINGELQPSNSLPSTQVTCFHFRAETWPASLSPEIASLYRLCGGSDLGQGQLRHDHPGGNLKPNLTPNSGCLTETTDNSYPLEDSKSVFTAETTNHK